MRIFHRIELLLLLSLILVSASVRADTASIHGPIKVLELNFNSEECPNDPDYVVRDLRFNGLVDRIKKESPDVIFLEEAWSYRDDHSVAFTLARTIGYDLSYRLEMGLPDFFYEADAVLSKKELHMTEERDLKLPHSAIEIGDGKTWIIELGAVSYAIGAKLTLADGSPLFVYATHLTGSSASDRADQVNAILDNARSWTKADGIDWNQSNIILGGDFNSATTEPSPNAVIRAGFTDSFAAAHPGDTSCSDCELPGQPWFNPFTLAAGLVPSQAAYNSELRDDYVFSRSPSFKPIASTLLFTAPYQGVWMSDHYGVLSTFGDSTVSPPANPVHDADAGPDSQIVTVTTDQFLCPDPWDYTGDPSGYPGGVGEPSCQISIPQTTVNGARGLTISNQSSFYINFSIDGPGIIFATQTAGLNPGEQATFTFNTPGEFPYTIRNNSGSPSPYGSELVGSVLVQKTGY